MSAATITSPAAIVLPGRRPLALSTDGQTEVVRRLVVTLVQHDCAYPVEVTLRYSPTLAVARPVNGELATAEAFNRAVKLAARNGLPGRFTLGTVVLVRESLRAARVTGSAA